MTLFKKKGDMRMSYLETKEIPFYDDTLLGIRDENGEIWLAIKSTCMQLGFNERRAGAQQEKIHNDKILVKGTRNFVFLTKGGKQSTCCLNEKYVPLWLAKISITKKMEEDIPDVVEKLEKYQLEAADVLHKAFYETDEQKESLHNSLGIEGEVANLKIAVEATTAQLKDQSEKLQKVMDNMTINTIQQGRLLSHAKDRVRFLLGGTHSDKYKEDSRKYFSNLWMNFKETFICASYKDLNPKYFVEALEFVDGWNYRER